jgi:hypothetical protein
LESPEYWVLLHLALDIALFALVLYFIYKLRELSGRLTAAQPAGVDRAEEIAAFSQKLAALEQRFDSWTSHPPDRISGPPPLSRGEPQKRQPGVFTPESDSGKSLRLQVEDLASRGLSPQEIARHLRLQPAEVKVALDLSRILPR